MYGYKMQIENLEHRLEDWLEDWLEGRFGWHSCM